MLYTSGKPPFSGGNRHGMFPMHEFPCCQEWFRERSSQAFVPRMRLSIYTKYDARQAVENKNTCDCVVHEWFVVQPYWIHMRGLGAIRPELGSWFRRRTRRKTSARRTNRHSWTGWIMAFPPKKRRKLWVWTAVDRVSGRLLDWELGDRDTETLYRLLNRLKKYNITICYTDHWEAYTKLIPPELLVQTKRETHGVERLNCRLRHWFGRFRRRTIIVSKSVQMVDVTLALFAAFWVNGDQDHLLSLITWYSP